MKKIVMTLCVSALALSVLSAAPKAKKSKKSSKSSGSAYSKVAIQKDPKTKKAYDFGGMTVIIGDWWSNPDAAMASKQQEDQKAFRDWMETTYNYKAIQKDCAGWGEHPNFVNNFCITGGAENYCFLIDGRSIMSGMKAGLFYDLSKVTNVDWKNAKWDQTVISKMSKGKSFYGFSYGHPEPKGGVFFNKRILQENGYDADYPYDLQKSGKWTWETFEEMCKKMTKDTDNDGVIDQYGMSSFNTEFAYEALNSNGAALVSKDKDGKFYNSTGDKKAIEAMNWTFHMFKEYQLPQPEGGNWDFFYTAFMNGETAFLADHEYNAQPNGRLSSMKDDWGFVCFPKGPSGDGKYHMFEQSNVWVIPAILGDDRASKVMKIVDFYTEDVPGYDSPDAWKDGYYAGFRDSRAVDETLVYMGEGTVARYDYLITGLNQGDIFWQLYNGTTAVPQELYEACKNNWDALIADCN